jgi:hypothetical protein
VAEAAAAARDAKADAEVWWREIDEERRGGQALVCLIGWGLSIASGACKPAEAGMQVERGTLRYD